MKTGQMYQGILLAFGMLTAPLTMQGDIVERKFFQKSTGKSASGFVFQGSRNMRNQKSGKKRPFSGLVAAPFSVPSLSPTGEIKRTQQNQPRTKPRFGYGAEERKEERKTATPRKETVKPNASAEPGPVYQFRYTYPVYRDYFFGNPFLFSPRCYRGGHGHYSHGVHGGHSAYHHSPFSFFFGW